MPLCRIVRLRHGLYADTTIRCWAVHSGNTARHRMTGEKAMDAAARRRDATEASHEY